MSTLSHIDTDSAADTGALVVLAHAYSPLNRGDGLLVDLARQIVDDALGNVDLRVVAINAAAFASHSFVQWGRGSSVLPQRLALLAAGALGPDKQIRDLLERADVIVAVGGGYLRGSTAVESLKSWNAHYAQLRFIARWGHKAVYLPQSVGPFPALYRRAVSKRLARVRSVFLRDDRSVQEFAIVPGVRRAPDLAVLAMMGSDRVQPKPLSNASPIFVARDLDRPRTYYTLLAQVASKDYTWAVQSIGSGNNDQPITSRLSGVAEPPLLSDLLGAPTGRVVVSTRLHGSLAALLAGYPSIHLSYERKGWGAFGDLGLPEYVLNARDASLDQIEALVERIKSDESAYWAAIEARRTSLRDLRDEVIASLRTATTPAEVPA